MVPYPIPYDTVSVVADDRERSSQVVAALESMDGVELAVRRLDLGDYLVGPRLLVERKHLHDFVLSLSDGRLFLQTWRLAGCASYRCCLVLEGPAVDLDRRRAPPRGLQGALITISILFGLPVLRSSGPVETARLLISAGRQLQRRSRLGSTPPRIAHSRAASPQLAMLLAVPGIGPERATALLRHFGSIRALALADPRDLTTVEGVGPTTARRLAGVLDISPYEQDA
jgi:DNA excision repair protein ERCC-4